VGHWSIPKSGGTTLFWSASGPASPEVTDDQGRQLVNHGLSINAFRVRRDGTVALSANLTRILGVRA